MCACNNLLHHTHIKSDGDTFLFIFFFFYYIVFFNLFSKNIFRKLLAMSLTLLKSSQVTPKIMLIFFFVAAKIFMNTNSYLRKKPKLSGTT